MALACLSAAALAATALTPRLFPSIPVGQSAAHAAAAAEPPPRGESSRPALRTRGPLSPRNASYRMRAILDDQAHKVTGKATLVWHNLERQPAAELVFHLYQNAFKNYASTFIREAGPQLRGDEMLEHGFGAIDVTALRIGGRDQLARATVNDTLLTVPLDTPVGPSALVEVELEWTTTLPKVFARSGWIDSFHAVTQWFPKIGVWECPDNAASPMACRWRAHQYHGHTEFFSDYGVYDVELDLPLGSAVGATGMRGKVRIDGKRQIVGYHAEDVHDFAFFTDPRFIEVRGLVTDSLGTVRVHLLTRPGQEVHNARHFAAAQAAIQEGDKRFGPYPYSDLTVVVPPSQGNGAGGMEYPTIITSIAAPLPPGLRFLEETTAHEYGHQYFYGMIGTDEVEEAWLDEGLNTAFTDWAMERLHGPRCTVVDLPYVCLNQRDLGWLGYRMSTRRAPLSTPSYLVPRGSYVGLAYSQPAVTLHTLEGLLGPAKFQQAMRRYAERYRFRHPTRADFMAAMSEGANEDLSWFFRQALESTRVVDYAVTQVQATDHQLLAGLWDCPPRPQPDPPDLASDPKQLEAWRATVRDSQQAACDGKPAGRHELVLDDKKPDKKAKLYDNEVWVQRTGDFILPVDIKVVFSDGVTVIERWSVEEQEKSDVRIKTWRYPRRATQVVRAEVDPEGKLSLDEKRINNGMLAQPDPRPISRLWGSWLGAVQTLLDWGML